MAKNETTFRHILFGMVLCDIFISWFQNMSERHMFQHNLTSFFNVSCGNFRKTLRIYVAKYTLVIKNLIIFRDRGNILDVFQLVVGNSAGIIAKNI